MKNFFRKSFVLFSLLTVLAAGYLFAADETLLVEDFALPLETKYGTKSKPLSKAQEFVLDMGFGWNLGNTLDAGATLKSGVDSEIGWNQPRTTKEMIDGLVAAGIKTLRIPISYTHHFVENEEYVIDPAWLNRIQQIVDWGINDGLYVIINTHHDNATYSRSVSKKSIKYDSGYYPLEKDKDESLKFLTSVWRQVAERFKDYDEKLIFETMNEPRLHAGSLWPCASGNHEWTYHADCPTCQEAAKMIVLYNQEVLNTIRATGGNNKSKRYVMIPCLCASPDSAFVYLEEDKTPFYMVKDSAKDHLILSVHMYTPYNFAMNVWGGSTKYFTDAERTALDENFEMLESLYLKNGIPVIIGEMGATNKDNLKDRAEWFAYFAGNAKCYGITCCLWDNGNAKAGEEGFGYYNRSLQEWFFPILHQVAVDNVNYAAELIHENMGH